VTAGIVPHLEVEPALQRLGVGYVRLGLDARSPRTRIAAPDLGVPGPKVARDRNRHFRPPAEGGVESSTKAIEQRHLGAIPDRISGGEGAKSQVEAEDGAVRHQEFEIRICDLASLEPTDAGMRRIDRAAHVSLTESCTCPSDAPVVRHAPNGRAAAPPSPINRTLTRWHPGRSCHGLLRRRFTHAHGTPSVHSGDRSRFACEIGDSPLRSRTPSDRIDARGHESGGSDGAVRSYERPAFIARASNRE